MKCNQSGPGFELVWPCPFPTTIAITPRAPPRAKEVHTFPKGICPKVNAIARLEYELAHYDSAVHRFNHYTTRTPEDRHRCQLSTSPWSILEKPGTSKWSSHHPCPEPWWTAWLSRAWCVVVGRVFCLCPPEGRWWRSFLCKAPIPPAKASPFSCNAEHRPYYPTYTEKMVLWLQTDPFSTQNY